MRAAAALTTATFVALSGMLTACTPSAPTPPAPPSPETTVTQPSEAPTPSGDPAPSASESPVASDSPTFDPSATPATPGTPEFSATPSTTPGTVSSPGLGTPADSLEAAFAQPENGGIASFLSKHPDYLPATVVIGAEVVSGSSTGPVELNLKNLPPTTTRMYMAIACTESKPYKMELTRADGSAVATSWGESCGYWGGLNGYTTTPFDISNPPARMAITVDASTKFSYVLYASPGR